jgi:hypothetical protein
VGGLQLRALNEFPLFLLEEWPRLPFTARIGRAHSDRARSASKKGTWLLLLRLLVFPANASLYSDA